MKSSQSPKNPYEALYGKPLTPQQVAEMNFNLSTFVESLAEMEKQQKERLNRQDNRGSDNSQ